MFSEKVESEFEKTTKLLSTGVLSSLKQIQQIEPLHWGIFSAAIVLFSTAKIIANCALIYYILSAIFGVVFMPLFVLFYVKQYLPAVSIDLNYILVIF
jgi:hypothetical protein